jgi:hypothetical protein
MRPRELRERKVRRFAVLPRTLLTEGSGGCQHGSLRRQLPGEERLKGGSQKPGDRRAPGKIIVNLNDLIKSPHSVEKRGERDGRAVDPVPKLGAHFSGVICRRGFLIDVTEDRLAVKLVREARDSSRVGAGSIGDHHVAFPAEQAGHFFLFGRPDGAVDQRRTV